MRTIVSGLIVCSPIKAQRGLDECVRSAACGPRLETYPFAAKLSAEIAHENGRIVSVMSKQPEESSFSPKWIRRNPLAPSAARCAESTPAFAAKESRMARIDEHGLCFISPLQVAWHRVSESASPICVGERQSILAAAAVAPNAPSIGGGYQPPSLMSIPL